jgi:uncharacterized protein YjbI with pentapeptide repeats
MIADMMVWLNFDNESLAYDEYGRFVQSIKIFNALSSPDSQTISEIIYSNPLYPPLGSLLSAPAYFITGISSHVDIEIQNSILLLILILSVFGIGNKLKNPLVGVLAAFIMSIYPVTFGAITHLVVELPLSAMFASFTYCLLLTEFFTSKKYSVLLGVVTGLGILSKFTFLAIFLIPLGYYLFCSFKQNRVKDKIINFCLFVFSGFLTCSWYIIPKLSFLLHTYLPSIGIPLSGRSDTDVFTNPIFGSFYYVLGLPNTISIFFTVLFFLTIPCLLYYKNEKIVRNLLIITLVEVYVILTLISVKEPRYMMATYFIVAITSALGLYTLFSWLERRLGKKSLKAKKVTVVTLSLFVVSSIFFNLDVSYGQFFASCSYVYCEETLPQAVVKNEKVFSPLYGYDPRPVRLNFHSESIFHVLHDHKNFLKEKTLIFFFSEDPSIIFPLSERLDKVQIKYKLNIVGAGEDNFTEDNYHDNHAIILQYPPQYNSFRADSNQTLKSIEGATRLFLTMNSHYKYYEPCLKLQDIYNIFGHFTNLEVYCKIYPLKWWSPPSPENPNLISAKTGSCAKPPSPNIYWANCNFANVNLAGDNLKESNLSGANLTNSILTKADLSSGDMSGVILQNANLAYSNLSFVRLANSNLYNSSLFNADVHEANLSNAILSGAYMVNSTLYKTDLHDADLWMSNLVGSDLHGSNLSASNLSDADIYNADLSHVDLSNADLSDANLSGANLSGANLDGTNLSDSNINGTILFCYNNPICLS